MAYSYIQLLWSVTEETVGCDAPASGYSYSAIFEYLNALYPSNVPSNSNGDLEASCVFPAEAGHLYYVGGKTKQRSRMVIEKEDDQLKIINYL